MPGLTGFGLIDQEADDGNPYARIARDQARRNMPGLFASAATFLATRHPGAAATAGSAVRYQIAQGDVDAYNLLRWKADKDFKAARLFRQGGEERRSIKKMRDGYRGLAKAYERVMMSSRDIDIVNAARAEETRYASKLANLEVPKNEKKTKRPGRGDRRRDTR